MAGKKSKGARTSKQSTAAMTYKCAGVDIDAGEKFVGRIRRMVKKTYTPRVVKSYGGFAGMFRLDYNERLFKQNYTEPLLVACTDGVGTKLKVAFRAEKFDTVGVDLVAMNVNDLVCCGAEPLFFLDYLAVGELQPERCAAVVKGIADGCRQAGCAMLGGETAEMPGFYGQKEFDLAGFAVGVVERNRVVDGRYVRPGDVAVAVASDGLHSNGFGLARKVLFEKSGYRLTDSPPELEGATLGEELLRPTRIYTPAVLDVLRAYRKKRVVRAMAHITGGGIPGNLPRALPDGLTVRIKRDSWYVPPIFKLIAARGPVDQIEMMRVFNMGVGFVMIVAQRFAASVMARLRKSRQRCWILGKVRKGGPEIQWA